MIHSLPLRWALGGGYHIIYIYILIYKYIIYIILYILSAPLNTSLILLHVTVTIPVGSKPALIFAQDWSLCSHIKLVQPLGFKVDSMCKLQEIVDMLICIRTSENFLIDKACLAALLTVDLPSSLLRQNKTRLENTSSTDALLDVEPTRKE